MSRFRPCGRRRLEHTAQEAHAWLDAQLQAILQSSGSRWALPALTEIITSSEANFELADAYPIDSRGVIYSFAFSAPSVWARGSTT